MDNEVYIYEGFTGLYVPITRKEMADLLCYVVKEGPTCEDLIYEMIANNQMSAIYGQHLLRAAVVNYRVGWIDFRELYNEECDDFPTVYDMSFEPMGV